MVDDTEIHRIVEKVVNQLMGGNQAAATPAPAQVAKPVEALPTQEKGQQSIKKVVAIGSDHGGFDLKENLRPYLAELGYDTRDAGAYNKGAVDYPDFAHEVAKLVSTGKAWRGIVIDGAGIGSCIVANKVPGIRAGMAYDYSSAVNSREHNDTNVLTLGAGLIGTTLARLIVKTWLSTEFAGGRHVPRIEKITAVEKQYLK
jgi:ribose 5-phosphate isomerase B